MLKVSLTVAVSALALLVTTGCASDRTAVLVASAMAPRVPNLALSPQPDRTLLAMQFPRDDWPAMERGYRFEDTIEYNVFGYEYQMNFDENGGLFWGSEVVGSGALVR
jgi:hypothetical protein